MSMMKKQELILATFFRHQLVMKMFHFQTKKYGHHKESDVYLTGFAVQMDKYMETSQGHFGIVTTKSMDLNIKTVTDQTVDKYLGQFVEFLDSFDSMLSKEYGDLLVIRDDMRIEAVKLRYLLKFD